MKPDRRELFILHVEDDRMISLIVKSALQDCGFEGSIVPAASVREASELLAELETAGQPIHMILTDMNLPDGSGLDVIRMIKSRGGWQHTPVIVLSSDTDPKRIDAAYGAGANAWLPKIPDSCDACDVLESFYRCWMLHTVWPSASMVDRLQSAVARSSRIRAEMSEFYLRAARASQDPSDSSFWLGRALNEGNLSNLLAFVQPLVSESDAPPGLVNRLVAMQDLVQASLRRAEDCELDMANGGSVRVCSLAIEILANAHEEDVAKIVDCIFTLTPEAREAFRKQAAAQLLALSGYVLAKTNDSDLKERAKELRAWGERWG